MDVVWGKWEWETEQLGRHVRRVVKRVWDG